MSDKYELIDAEYANAPAGNGHAPAITCNPDRRRAQCADHPRGARLIAVGYCVVRAGHFSPAAAVRHRPHHLSQHRAAK